MECHDVVWTNIIYILSVEQGNNFYPNMSINVNLYHFIISPFIFSLFMDCSWKELTGSEVYANIQECRATINATCDSCLRNSSNNTITKADPIDGSSLHPLSRETGDGRRPCSSKSMFQASKGDLIMIPSHFQASFC